MSEMFEHAFLAKQQALRPHLDVHFYAGVVKDLGARMVVRNPNGMLIHLLCQADKQVRPGIASADAMTRAELERYAELWVELLKRVSTMGLTPRQIAKCLGVAREHGYQKLNRLIEVRLHNMGEDWPAPERRRSHESRTASSARKEAS